MTRRRREVPSTAGRFDSVVFNIVPEGAFCALSGIFKASNPSINEDPGYARGRFQG